MPVKMLVFLHYPAIAITTFSSGTSEGSEKPTWQHMAGAATLLSLALGPSKSKAAAEPQEPAQEPRSVLSLTLTMVTFTPDLGLLWEMKNGKEWSKDLEERHQTKSHKPTEMSSAGVLPVLLNLLPAAFLRASPCAQTMADTSREK